MSERHVKADLQYRSVFHRKDEPVRGLHVRGADAPLPSETDDGALPQGAGDRATALWLAAMFVAPYSARRGGHKGLTARQRNYLLYRVFLDIGRLKRRGCTVGPWSYETALVFVAWAGASSRAEEMLASMKAQHMLPTAKAYDAVLQAFARRGDLEGFAKHRTAMRRQGYPPTIHTYNSALYALCNHANRAAFDRGALPGLPGTATGALPCPQNKAWKVFNAMVQDGVLPKYTTFKVLMEASRSYKIGVTVLGAMAKYRMEPTAAVKRALLETCQWKKEVAYATSLYGEMVQEGQGGSDALNSYLKVLKAAAALPVALRAVEDHTRSGAVLSTVGYAHLLETVAGEIAKRKASAHGSPGADEAVVQEYRASLVGLAEGVFEQAMLAGHAPHRFVYDGMAAVYAAAGRPDGLTALEEKQVEQGLSVSGKFQRYLVAAAGADGLRGAAAVVQEDVGDVAPGDVDGDDIPILADDVRRHQNSRAARSPSPPGPSVPNPRAALTHVLAGLAGVPTPADEDAGGAVDGPHARPRRTVQDLITSGVNALGDADRAPIPPPPPLPRLPSAASKKVPDLVHRTRLLKLVRDVLARG
eukprot:TRINITY_DN11225_c0_g1_i1.p1 TRINITY_DN11225_c0_g1~~TRINITY_DN11225_c0_g1_i1.p1  ORF type:complete len:628 (+),score=182.89 TRINITY_DN11225_c0_g1_i1:122-1885(+)